jgi:predicted ATPase
MPDAAATVPYLLGLRLLRERISDADAFPFTLGFLRGELELSFSAPVTFFVGENGSGKSTLIEAIAALSNLPVSGGSRAELGANHGPELDSSLAPALRPAFRKRPRQGYFLRAEFYAHLASLLDQRSPDPGFDGGRNLHQRSHGEAFLALIQNRMRSGMILLDEPESALSPQRQIALLAIMARMVGTGDTQFIIATHSPILMTYPRAEILSFDDGQVHPVRLQDTAHFQITKGILDSPQRYWKHLLDSTEEDREE